MGLATSPQKKRRMRGKGDPKHSDDASPVRAQSPKPSPHESGGPSPGTGGGSGGGPKPPKGRERERKGQGKDDKGLGKSKVLQTAEQNLKAVQQITPFTIWKNSFRENEIQSRLKKAGQSITDVEKFQATLADDNSQREDCGRILKKISDTVDGIGIFQGIIAKLKSKKVMEELRDATFHTALANALNSGDFSVDPDTQSAIIAFIGQKVVEDRSPFH